MRPGRADVLHAATARVVRTRIACTGRYRCGARRFVRAVQIAGREINCRPTLSRGLRRTPPVRERGSPNKLCALPKHNNWKLSYGWSPGPVLYDCPAKTVRVRPTLSMGAPPCAPLPTILVFFFFLSGPTSVERTTVGGTLVLFWPPRYEKSAVGLPEWTFSETDYGRFLQRQVLVNANRRLYWNFPDS